MRKILKSRLLRCVICLLLIGCFLLNSSPLRAKALEPVTTTVSTTVAVAVAVAAAFQVLGVMSGSDPVSFNDAVNNCVTYLINSTSFVVNGMVQVLGVSSDSLVRSFLMKDFIQACWEWLFSSGTVKQSIASVSHSFTLKGSSVSVTSNIPCEFVLIWRTGYAYYASCTVFAYAPVSSGDALFVYWGDSTLGSSIYGDYYVTQCKGFNGTSYDTTCVETSLRVIHDTRGANKWEGILTDLFGEPFSSVYTDFDITLGQITGPFDGTGVRKLEETEEYQGYGTKIIEFPSSDPNNPGGESDLDKVLPWLPAGIPSPECDDSTTTQTQEDAQSGETGLEFDFDTETDPDSGLDPDPDPDPGTNSGSSSWTPPSDMGKFTLDLKQYFPFCIPFDLYAFFTCLNAEPVAPVIEWLIPLPGGKTYPFEIDLSVFDPVAQILRRMELLLFCVGLAFKTRDLIKG